MVLSQQACACKGEGTAPTVQSAAGLNMQVAESWLLRALYFNKMTKGLLCSCPVCLRYCPSMGWRNISLVYVVTLLAGFQEANRFIQLYNLFYTEDSSTAWVEEITCK